MGVKADDGTRLWSYPWVNGSKVNAATPLVMNGSSVFITTGYGRGCAMFDITRNGAVRRWENRQMQAHFSSPILYNGYIYGTTDPGFLLCMDPNTGNVLGGSPALKRAASSWWTACSSR